jgi:uncharacterized protein YdeI (YjbR/CyaY-like superfamily)
VPPPPAAPDDSVEVTTLAQWRAWLQANHTRLASVWLVTYKKGASRPSVSYDDVVSEALCWGWIDSLPRKLDAERTMLRFSPRSRNTGWSALNKRRVARMLAEHRMQPAGLAKIEAAKADGSWSRLDAVDALEVPADLAKALKAQKGAAAAFDGFPRSVKRGILEWILGAKKPETRAKRILETATLAAQGKRANQWRS